MTVDPKVNNTKFILYDRAVSALNCCSSQAIQHVFQKSGYNYTKKTSQNFMAYLIAGPGIATMLGKVLCPYE